MNELLNIWEKLVKETSEAQILEGPKRGFVKNFLIDDTYYRETAFAAKIFAVEYIRTNNKEFLNRSLMCLTALQDLILKIDISQGIDEPVWTPRGVRYRKGSIPATIILIYAIEDTSRLINTNFQYDIKGVLKYLEECYLGDGMFYHDKVEKGKKYHKVINTTAMAYFFLEFAKYKGIVNSFFNFQIEKIKRAIINSQREDGFFPYINPILFQKIIFKFHRFLPRKLLKAYNILMGDNSIFFGDALHHLIVLYYYLLGVKYRDSKLSDKEKEMLLKGLKFIEKHLKKDKYGIYFDFSWEPKPRNFRYCNFIDTSFYFYLLDFLRLMREFNLISTEKREAITNGILKYINNKLLQNKVPSICPYQGGEDFIHLIMPRPSESVFDKGFFLSNLILEKI